MKILCLLHSVLKRIQECIAVTLPDRSVSLTDAGFACSKSDISALRGPSMIGELNAASLSRKDPPSHIVIVAAILSRAITLELDDDQTFHATGHDARIGTSGLVEMVQRHRHLRPEFRLEGCRMRTKMASDRSRGGFGRIGSRRRHQLGSRRHQPAPDDIPGRPRRLQDLGATNASGADERQSPYISPPARPPAARAAADRTEP